MPSWFVAILLVMAATPVFGDRPGVVWSPSELGILHGLWIGSLPPLPPDPTNKVGDDPRAARLGHRLFFDTRLSSDGQVACATCHLPGLAFTDGRKLGRGVGTAGRNTMTIIGTAYSPWFFWDGRKDSQWSQALGPLESSVEHGGTRTQYAHLISSDANYRAAYEALFGPLPELSDNRRFPRSAGPVDDSAMRTAWEGMALRDREAISHIFANIGKAIAAYERRLIPGPSLFDRYVEAVTAGDASRAAMLFSADESAGLRLFIGPGKCIRCHNGPLFTNNVFHDTGVPDPTGGWTDRGRLAGVRKVLSDEFNCFSRYSDARSSGCNELRFVKTDDPHFARGFKTPTLRNVAKTGPYMHDGQFATLSAVLDHYNSAPRQDIGRTELSPLGFDPLELGQIEKFLRTLESATGLTRSWLEPPP